MRTSIKSLIVGDVIFKHGFTSRVLTCQHYENYASVTVEFISGNKDDFDYLARYTDKCQIQGSDSLVLVELIQANFIPE